MFFFLKKKPTAADNDGIIAITSTWRRLPARYRPVYRPGGVYRRASPAARKGAQELRLRAAALADAARQEVRGLAAGPAGRGSVQVGEGSGGAAGLGWWVACCRPHTPAVQASLARPLDRHARVAAAAAGHMLDEALAAGHPHPALCALAQLGTARA